MALRWATLIVVIISTAFNYLYLPFVFRSAGLDSNDHPYYLSPVEYGHGLGMLIPLCFLIYAMHQLLPQQQSKILYDRLTGPVIFTSAFGIFRVVLADQDTPGLKVLATAMMTINAMVMLRLVRSRILDCSYSPWLTIPFSLNAGFLAVAIFADISLWLKGIGWYDYPPGESAWTVLMIVAVFALAVSVSVKYKDWLYSIVLTYTIISIWWAKPENVAVNTATLFVGMVLAIWSAGYAAYCIREQITSTGGMEEIENI